MAIRYLTEQFSNGLVETRDALSLEPGELYSAVNVWYTKSDSLLHKVPAITTAKASASACAGLQPLSFLDGSYLLTHGNGAYYKSTITESSGALSNWSAVVTGLSATALPTAFSAVQYNNKYVLLDGLNTNQVLRSDGTVRRHGLQPVNAVCIVATATAGANTWPGRTTGYFDYWYTEAVEQSTSPEDLIIESAYEATVSTEVAGSPTLSTGNAVTSNGRAVKIAVATANVTTMATQVYIDLPLAPRNSRTTHYYVYRSEAKEFEVEPSFPIGERIARIAIPTSDTDSRIVDGRLRLIDGVVTTSGPFYPSVYVTNTVSSGITWTNPANVACTDVTGYSDGSYGRLTVNTSSSLSPIGTNQIVVSTLSATGISDPVAQIKITMRARLQGGFTSSGVTLNTRISGDGGNSWSANVPITLTATAFTDVATAYSNYGATQLSTGDISNTNLRIRIDVTGYKPTTGAGTGYVDIDGLKVEIKHNGTQPIPIAPYPGIVLQVGQEQFVTSKGGEPPVANVGCIFQGSLVTNDVSNKNMVRWSMAGEIDAFPALYFFPVTAPTGSSEITYLGIVNNICIIGMKGAIARVNYLPTENDSSFTRDRIYDYISTELGILNQSAATIVRLNDGREALAVVTTSGIYITDGFTIHKVDEDMDWGQIVDAMAAGSTSIYSPANIILVNETFTENLMLFYTYSGTTEVKPLNWSVNHTKKGGQFKLGGTRTLATVTGAACTMKTTYGYHLVYMLGTDYVVYVMRPSYASVISGSIYATTRSILFNTPPSEFDITQVYVYTGTTVSGGALTAYVDRTGQSQTTVTSSTISGTHPLNKVDLSVSGEMVKLQFIGANNNTDHSLGHLTIEYDDQLGTESM